MPDHRVSLRPCWAPDKRTAELLGVKARRIVAWTAACTRCEWEVTTPAWSDARRFGRNHRTGNGKLGREGR